MTIDARLEALTQTAELLAHTQLESEKTFGSAIASVTEAQAKTEKAVNRMGRYAMVIARNHETKIAALEEEDAPDA